MGVVIGVVVVVDGVAGLDVVTGLDVVAGALDGREFGVFVGVVTGASIGVGVVVVVDDDPMGLDVLKGADGGGTTGAIVTGGAATGTGVATVAGRTGAATLTGADVVELPLLIGCVDGAGGVAMGARVDVGTGAAVTGDTATGLGVAGGGVVETGAATGAGTTGDAVSLAATGPSVGGTTATGATVVAPSDLVTGADPATMGARFGVAGPGGVTGAIVIGACAIEGGAIGAMVRSFRQ